MLNQTKLLIGIITFFLVVSCKARRDAYAIQSGVESNEPSKDLYETLVSDVETGRTPDFHTFVSTALPDEMFSVNNYILYQESHSMCGEDVSPDYPRVVMFYPEADLFVAFIGNPDGACFGKVELIKFTDSGYIFNLIDFSKQKKVMRNLKDPCSDCHSKAVNDNVVNVPIWKVGQIFSKHVNGIWHPEAYAGKKGFIVDEEEKRRFLSFVPNKKKFPYSRLQGSYDPIVGKVSALSALTRPNEETIRVPFGLAFNRFDNYFEKAQKKLHLFKSSMNE